MRTCALSIITPVIAAVLAFAPPPGCASAGVRIAATARRRISTDSGYAGHVAHPADERRTGVIVAQPRPTAETSSPPSVRRCIFVPPQPLRIDIVRSINAAEVRGCVPRQISNCSRSSARRIRPP